MSSKVDLIYSGLMEEFLSTDPDMSHFLYRFNQHTPFSFDTQEMLFSGDIGYGKTIKSEISDSGDFLTNIGIELNISIPLGAQELPSQNGFIHHFERIELYIGNKLIESLSSENIYYQHMKNMSIADKRSASLISGIDTEYNERNRVTFDHSGSNIIIGYIDLPFYFYQNLGKSIPICKLSKQNVSVVVKLRDYKNLNLNINDVVENDPKRVITYASLHVDYGYCTEDERSFFLNNTVEHVITQEQKVSIDTNAMHKEHNIYLPFYGPVSYIYFYIENQLQTNDVDAGRYNSPMFLNKIKRAKLKFNNTVVFDENELFFINQNLKYNEGIYSEILSTDKGGASPQASFFPYTLRIDTTGIDSGFIYPYHFGFKHIKSHTGSVNMSRIIDKILTIELDNNQFTEFKFAQSNFIKSEQVIFGRKLPNDSTSKLKINVHAINYNIITFRDGICGLKYS